MTEDSPASFTVDASVYCNAMRVGEPGHEASVGFLQALADRALSVIEPSLLLPEVARVLARSGMDEVAASRLARELAQPANVVLVGLDAQEAGYAAEAAARGCLRGAEAVYVSVARRYGSALVSLDAHQLERAAGVVRALTPAEALAELR